MSSDTSELCRSLKMFFRLKVFVIYFMMFGSRLRNKWSEWKRTPSCWSFVYTPEWIRILYPWCYIGNATELHISPPKPARLGSLWSRTFPKPWIMRICWVNFLPFVGSKKHSLSDFSSRFFIFSYLVLFDYK